MRCSPVLAFVITIFCGHCWVDAAEKKSTADTGSTQQQVAPKTQCKEKEFRCLTSQSVTGYQCIEIKWKCDGEQECADGSDEFPEICEADQGKCGPDSYRCKPLKPDTKWTKCVPKAFVCDGVDDCPHDDDEKNCPEEQCNSIYEFRCVSDGTCVEKRQVCDYTRDCSDGSDEVNCEFDDTGVKYTYSPQESSKAYGNPEGKNVWPAYSDEKASLRKPGKAKETAEVKRRNKKPALVSVKESVCGRGEFKCVKGDVKCVLRVQECNGINDCEDGSDEDGCSCMPHEFTCNDSRQCVDKFARCNGTVECRDGSDEQKCTSVMRCDRNKEFNCGDGTCVQNVAVCDFNRDCPNGADEDESLCWERCKSICHHHCVRGPQPYCACREGYMLKADMITCEDVDECLTPGTCSHRCINTPGAYTCQCADDYLLEVSPEAYIGSGQNLTIDDAWFMRSPYHLETNAVFFKQRRSVRQSVSTNSTVVSKKSELAVRKSFCKARYGGAPDFLVVRAHEILLYNSSTHRIRTLQTEQRAPFSVDYHYGDGVIVWTDYYEPAVYRASMQSPGRRTKIAEGDGVDSVAVDWIHKHVYFTDPVRKTLEVVYLHPLAAMEETGKYVKITLVKEGLMAPRAIQLDPEEGWMYWSDWGGDAIPESKSYGKRSTRTGKIERAGMDGSRREQIWPPVRYLDSTGMALALDTPSEYYLYWVNGLALDRINQRLYFVDAWNRFPRGGGKLASIRVDGTDYRFIMSSAQSLKYVVGITLWEDDIIWADHGGDGVAACNKFRGDQLRHIFGGQNQSVDSIRLTAPVKRPSNGKNSAETEALLDMSMYDVKAVHPLAQRSSKLTDGSACVRGTHGCSHMCLPIPRNDNLLVNLVSDLSRHFSALFFGSTSPSNTSSSSSSSSSSTMRWRCVCPRTMQLALDHKTCVNDAAMARLTGVKAANKTTYSAVPSAIPRKSRKLTSVGDKAPTQILASDASNASFVAVSSQPHNALPFYGNISTSAVGDHGEREDEESVFYIWLMIAVIVAILLVMTSLYCICREPGDDMPVRTSRPHPIRIWQRQMTSRLTDFAAGSSANRSQFKHHRLHSPSISASVAGGEATHTETPAVHQHSHAAASIDDDDIVFQDIDLDEGDIIDGPYAKPKRQMRNNSLMPTGSSPLNSIMPRLQQVEQEQRRKSSAGKIVLEGAGKMFSQVRRISYSKRSSKNSVRNQSFDLGSTSSKFAGVISDGPSAMQPVQPIYQLSYTPPGSLPIEDVLGTCASSTASASTSSLVLEDGIPLVTDQV